MQHFETLCLLGGTSGAETTVREYILSQLGELPYIVDNLGNIIVEKKGNKTPSNQLMLSAHMDEVGMIITHIHEDGVLSFATVGGIDTKALLGKRVRIGERLGVIGTAPMHLSEDTSLMPKEDEMYIDIGAKDKAQAEQYVRPGDTAVFESAFVRFGSAAVKSKAIDDRFGCALLLELLASELPYDVTLCFCTMEEIGLKGAGAAASRVQPDIALVLESTTANDVCGVSGADTVCKLGQGAVVSFMDRGTVYDRALYQSAMRLAKEQGIQVQTKTKIAGGNDAAAIQTAGEGARVLALSLPTRYIHSAVSMAREEDMHSCLQLAKALIQEFGDSQ